MAQENPQELLAFLEAKAATSARTLGHGLQRFGLEATARALAAIARRVLRHWSEPAPRGIEVEHLLWHLEAWVLCPSEENTEAAWNIEEGMDSWVPTTAREAGAPDSAIDAAYVVSRGLRYAGDTEDDEDPEWEDFEEDEEEAAPDPEDKDGDSVRPRHAREAFAFAAGV